MSAGTICSSSEWRRGGFLWSQIFDKVSSSVVVKILLYNKAALKKGGFVIEKRVGGIEPPTPVWKTGVLPLYDTRIIFILMKIKKMARKNYTLNPLSNIREARSEVEHILRLKKTSLCCGITGEYSSTVSFV